MLCGTFQLIDFYRFEETFRIDHQQHRSKTVDGEDIVNGGGDGETPGTLRRGSRRFEAVSLLENNRMRNVGQSLRLLLFVYCIFHIIPYSITCPKVVY